MRVFCTIVSLMIFAALAILVVMLGQWMSVDGPEWLVSAGARKPGNPPVILSCILALVALGISTGFVVSSIWGEK